MARNGGRGPAGNDAAIVERVSDEKDAHGGEFLSSAQLTSSVISTYARRQGDNIIMAAAYQSPPERFISLSSSIAPTVTRRSAGSPANTIMRAISARTATSAVTYIKLGISFRHERLNANTAMALVKGHAAASYRHSRADKI